MVEIGYKLSSEELCPNELVRYTKRAEEVGVTFAMISDHYHPPMPMWQVRLVRCLLRISEEFQQKE